MPRIAVNHQVTLPHGIMYHASAQLAELTRQRATVAFRNPLVLSVRSGGGKSVCFLHLVPIYKSAPKGNVSSSYEAVCFLVPYVGAPLMTTYSALAVSLPPMVHLLSLHKALTPISHSPTSRAVPVLARLVNLQEQPIDGSASTPASVKSCSYISPVYITSVITPSISCRLILSTCSRRSCFAWMTSRRPL